MIYVSDTLLTYYTILVFMFTGVNAPRRTASNGQELPSSRLVSTRVAQDSDSPSSNYTLLVMQWGQFLDHDLTHTPINFGK